MSEPYVPYIAALSTIDEVLTQAHLRQDYDVIEYEDTYTRGSVTSARIVVRNPGLSLFSPNTKGFVAVIESPDGTFANARVLLVGRVVPRLMVGGGTLGSHKVELTVEAAPINVQNLLYAYAVANCQARPTYDYLADDLDFGKLDGVLIATSKSWLIDPVTHAISLVDNVDGNGKITNLDSNYVHKSLRLLDTGKKPAKRVKVRAQVQIDQRAYGSCNIAGLVNGQGTASITTMDANHFEGALDSLPTKYVNYGSGGGGWKKEPGTDVCSGYVSLTPWIYTGRIYTGQLGSYSIQPPPAQIPIQFYEYCTMYYMTYSYMYNYMMYDYSQSRTETVDVFLDYAIQDVGGVASEVDLGVVNVKDLYVGLIPNPISAPQPDPTGEYVLPYAALVPVLPWSITTIYNQGDLCTLGNQTYQCQANNVTGYFYEDFAAVLTHANWVAVTSTAALPDQRTPSFFDTGRGQEMIEHLILRCEAAARNKSLAMTAEFDTSWETGILVGLGDTVRFTFWDASTNTGRAAKGTVKNRVRRISKSGKRMTFTLTIALGTGVSIAVPQVGPAVYKDPATSAALYYANLTSTLGLPQQTLQANFTSIYNFQTQYPQKLLGSYGIGRVAWTYGAQPLVAPVDCFQLQNPNYSVLQVTRDNEADTQFAIASSYGYRCWDPRDAPFEYPTRIDVTMRDIAASATIDRAYQVAAQAMSAPRGIDLVAGGEP